jgi:hypothetical protein
MTDKGEIGTKQEEAANNRTSFIDLPTKYDRYEPLAEIIATIVLAIGTLTAAWCGYQSALWGGLQAISFNQAGALRTESSRASTLAGQLTQIDIGLFINWINAYAAEDQRLVDFYQERFREEFKPAFNAWLATDPANNPEAPASPFAMPEYQLSAEEEADRLVAEAEAKFSQGTTANQNSDKYVLNTVILASVLFLGGIASRFKAMSARWVIICLSLVILVFGLYNVFTYPLAQLAQ